MNNKIVVAVVILLSVGVFACLVNYGWTYRHGSPETYELQGAPILTAGYKPVKLALKSGGVSDTIWQDLPGVEVRLHHQMTEQPWPGGLTGAVKVQTFHDGTDVYFRLTWSDDYPDTFVSVDSFTDACAIAVPVDVNAPVRSIMMGFSSPVNIWQWRADNDTKYWQGKGYTSTAHPDYTYPFEESEIFSVTASELGSAVTDMLSHRAGSLTNKPAQAVQGRGIWTNGNWSVVFKRSLTTGDSQLDCQFAWGRRKVAFAVWDGDQDQRGGRKSMSEWVTLWIEQSTGNKTTAGRSSDDPVRTQDTKKTGGSGRLFQRVQLKDKLHTLLASFSVLASVHASQGEDRPPLVEREPRVINIEAKRFEYVPNRISVRKGELVTLRMESLDVTHGLYLDGYGIDIKANPGLVAKATFLADKPGRFTFRCSETCGEFHPYMIGFFEVTPNRRFSLFLSAVGIAFVAILGVLWFRPQQNKGAVKNAGTE